MFSRRLTIRSKHGSSLTEIQLTSGLDIIRISIFNVWNSAFIAKQSNDCKSLRRILLPIDSKFIFYYLTQAITLLNRINPVTNNFHSDWSLLHNDNSWSLMPFDNNIFSYFFIESIKSTAQSVGNPILSTENSVNSPDIIIQYMKNFLKHRNFSGRRQDIRTGVLNSIDKTINLVYKHISIPFELFVIFLLDFYLKFFQLRHHQSLYWQLAYSRQAFLPTRHPYPFP